MLDTSATRATAATSLSVLLACLALPTVSCGDPESLNEKAPESPSLAEPRNPQSRYREELSGAFLASPTATPHLYLETIESQIHEATNRARAREGLAPLAPEPVLSLIAREHSADMIARRYFAHENPDGQGPGDRLAFGHRQLVGTAAENIWTGNGYPTESSAEREELADQVFQGWMNSPGHRANILRPSLTHLGVGVVIDGAEIMATQAFADVWGYMEKPLELRYSPDTEVRVDVSSLKGPTAGFAGLARSTSSQIPPRQSLSGPVHLPGEAGSFQFHLFFQNAPGRYDVVPGPTIEIG